MEVDLATALAGGGGAAGFNATNYGVVADGEVNPTDGSLTGTDNTSALQAAIDDCAAAGGGIVYLESGGMSSLYAHPLGTAGVGRGYRISGQVTIKTGVFLMGPFGVDAGLQDTAVQYSYGPANLIPPSGMPTFLIDNASTPAFTFNHGNAGILNCAFLWPGQVSANGYSDAYSPETVVVFPPAIYTGAHMGIVLQNLCDYNSYIFIDWAGQSLSRIRHIVSGSHHKIVDNTLNSGTEWDICDVRYGPGYVYNALALNGLGGTRGVHSGPHDVLLDLYSGGPSLLHDFQLTCKTDGTGAPIKMTSAWGSHISNGWIDQAPGPYAIEIHEAPSQSGGLNATAQHFVTNVEVGAGCSGGLLVDVPDSNANSGANGSFLLVSNSEFSKPSVINGVPKVLFSNCNLGGKTPTAAVSFDGTNKDSLGIAAVFSGCSFGGAAQRFNVTAGTVRIKTQGCSYIQNNQHVDVRTSGTMHVINLDRITTTTFRIPSGTVLSSGATTIGYIIPPQRASSAAANLVIDRSWGTGFQNDTWQIVDPGSTTSTLLKATTAISGHTMYAGALGRAYAGTTADGKDWFDGYASPIMSYVSSTGAPDAYAVQYNSVSGGTVGTDGLEVTILWSWD